MIQYRLRMSVAIPVMTFILGMIVNYYGWKFTGHPLDKPPAAPTSSQTEVSYSTPRHQPYTWTVTRIIDGDTVEVDAKFFPPELGNIQVRIRGIDTPESGGRAKCRQEAELAAVAKEKARLLLLGNKITVTDIIQDKYGGRLVGVVTFQGRRYSDFMIEQHLAVPYAGKTKQPWC